MAKEFLPIFLDFNETTQDLDDAQCGRLIRALVDYANGQERELQGTELIAYRFLKGTIDRNAKLSAIRAQAGAKGGRPKANESKEKQKEANESKEKQNTINKDNNNNNDNDSNRSFLDDDEAAGIQHEHDRIFTAAEDAGFKMSNTVRASLTHLYSEYGLDKMLAGFIECVNHGAVNLAYLQAVLKGSPKRVKAQEYEQRDYQSVQNELLARQNERILRRLQEAKEA